jgi:ligand-binding sensor protein
VHRRDRQTVQLAGSGDFGSNWSSSSRVASSWTKKDQYNVISELWNYSRFCDSYKTHTVINLKAPTINE